MLWGWRVCAGVPNGTASPLQLCQRRALPVPYNSHASKKLQRCQRMSASVPKDSGLLRAGDAQRRDVSTTRAASATKAASPTPPAPRRTSAQPQIARNAHFRARSARHSNDIVTPADALGVAPRGPTWVNEQRGPRQSRRRRALARLSTQGASVTTLPHFSRSRAEGRLSARADEHMEADRRGP